MLLKEIIDIGKEIYDVADKMQDNWEAAGKIANNLRIINDCLQQNNLLQKTYLQQSAALQNLHTAINHCRDTFTEILKPKQGYSLLDYVYHAVFNDDDNENLSKANAKLMEAVAMLNLNLNMLGIACRDNKDLVEGQVLFDDISKSGLQLQKSDTSEKSDQSIIRKALYMGYKVQVEIAEVDQDKRDLIIHNVVEAAKVIHRDDFVSLCGICNDGSKIMIVTENTYASLDTLLNLRQSKGVKVFEVAQQIINTIAYLHSKQFVHGRLTGSNLLFTDDTFCKVKLNLFAAARLSNELSEKGKDYLALELQKEPTAAPTMASDMYSFGKVLSNLFYGVIDTKDRFHTVAFARNPDPKLLEACDYVITNCLDIEPGNRPNAAYIAAEFESIIQQYKDENKQGVNKSQHRCIP